MSKPKKDKKNRKHEVEKTGENWLHWAMKIKGNRLRVYCNGIKVYDDNWTTEQKISGNKRNRKEMLERLEEV